MQPAVDVILCDRNYQTQVCLNHLALGLLDFGLGSNDGLLGALYVDSRRGIAPLDLPNRLAKRALLSFQLVNVFATFGFQGPANSVELRFGTANLLNYRVYRIHEAPSCLRSKSEGAQARGHIYKLVSILTTQSLELLRRLWLSFDLCRELYQFVVSFDDLVEFLNHVLTNLFPLLFKRLLSFGICCHVDDVLRIDLTIDKIVEQQGHFFDCYERSRQSFVDALVAALDPLGYADLVLASEQRHGTHLAKVQAHRVERLILAGFQINVDLLARFFGYLRRFFFLDLDGLPKRLSLVLIDFRNNAFYPDGGFKVLLRFVRRSYENIILIDSAFHLVVRCSPVLD